ncbi:MAG: RNase adapter RapZ [Firmicutes bacterium]|nr:RNase adapter RapZ [Bacillota bacterium]
MSIKEFVIIAGLSGAGKTTALRAFEDMDFFWVDNIPPLLIPKFAQLCSSSGFSRIALVADDMGDNFSSELQEALSHIDDPSLKKRIIFLDAPDDILVRRFSESYRRHPLSKTNGLLKGIIKERGKLQDIKGRADLIIDTGAMTASNLREEITRLFHESVDGAPPITISVMSFGYKYGIPLDADLVFDARILPNPFYEPTLQDKTGIEEEIQQFVFAGEEGEVFLVKLFDLVNFMVPQYIRRGKAHLTICTGCTGGRHRSVAVAVKLTDFLKNLNYNVFLDHRDINKN